MRRLALRTCFLLFSTALASGAQGPANPDLQRALAQIGHGEADQGIASLRELAGRTPAVPGATHALGVALYRTGKLLEAVQVLTHAEQEDPKDIEAVQLHGLALYRLGRPAAAIPYLKRVGQWTPDANADANHVLGLCYLNARQYDEARASFAAEFKVPPESAAAYLFLGRQLMLAQLPELAALAAGKALTLDPQLPMAHFMQGEIFLFKSQTDAALKEFEAERALNPVYAPVYERLGDLYSRVGELAEAQEVLMKALSLERSSTGPFILMGKVLLRRGDAEDALLYLRHAERMDPANVMTHTLLGQAYRGIGDDAKAKAEIGETARLNAANQLQLQPVK